MQMEHLEKSKDENGYKCYFRNHNNTFSLPKGQHGVLMILLSESSNLETLVTVPYRND